MNKFGCCVLVLMMLQESCRGELRLLQIVFQNGQRTPETVYPKDPYKFFWQNGPAKIAVVGMFQLFKLGQRLRRKYSDFVPAEPDEVDLFPSERGTPCSSLAECFLSGFYKPDKDQPFPPDLALPRPPGPMPNALEKYSEPDLKCHRLHLASSRIYESEEGSRIIGENMNLYQYWSENSGMEIKNPTDARELYQNLELEKSLNLSTPGWADRFWPELKQQSQIHFSWLAKSQDMQKMAAGPLLGLMTQRMQKNVDGQDQHKKYFVYSGKNSSLAGLLAIFGAFDGVEPSFGSTVVLELHRFGQLNYVRVLYFYSSSGSSHQDQAPEVVVIKGCSEYCPFEKFKWLTTSVVPDDWEYQCGLSSGSITLATIMLNTTGMVLLLMLIGYW